MKFPLGQRKGQQGAVLVLAAIAAAVLVGFLGLVIDLGRLFVTKTELQSAMDACSLAAAAELRPGVVPADAQALNRAVSAGMTAGNRNLVGFQAAAAGITEPDILFSDRLSNNSATFPYGYMASGAANPATARYALCGRNQGGINPWFMQVLENFLGVPSTPKSVGAWATATLSPAQASCALPIGMCMTSAGTSTNPFGGLSVGQWVTSKLSASATGSFDWIDFTPPNGGASELAGLIAGQGQCNIPPAGPSCATGGTCVGEQGNINSLNFAWNTRFGLYHGSYNATNATPDYTGYAYTPTSWPSKFNAFGGSSGATPNYQTAQSANTPYQGDIASGVDLAGGYSNSSTSTLQSKGAHRRLVTVPVVDCASWAASHPQTVPILGYACVLMLHPIGNSSTDVFLEYRGRSNDPASPCSTSGLAGGTVGPLVPVLVH